MEADINEFTRKSKKYRTKYIDELGKLYGMATRIKDLTQETTFTESNTNTEGVSIKSNIT